MNNYEIIKECIKEDVKKMGQVAGIEIRTMDDLNYAMNELYHHMANMSPEEFNEIITEIVPDERPEESDVRNIVDEAVDLIFLEIQNQTGKTGDISPADYLELDRLEEELTDLIGRITNTAPSQKNKCLKIFKDPETILEYDDFSVVRENDQYYYIDEDSCMKVELIAALTPSNDISSGGREMSKIFDCICCGEKINADGTATYLWFR